MQLSDFDFDLPESQIADRPVSPRDHSRLLAVDRQTGQRQDRHFYDVAELLQPGDLLVLNNTKVLPARLFGHDATGRKFEVFLLKNLGANPPRWQCLTKPGRKIGPQGSVITFADGKTAHVRRVAEREYEATFPDVAPEHFVAWLETVGALPLPPYIKRAAEAGDASTYQTVFAKDSGSVAAPTAGLHFTDELLAKIRARGVETAEVTLHIGYGTFSPIRVDDILEHDMHEEEYSVPQATWEKIQATRAKGGRVIAVGTTALRTLESIPKHGLSGATRLFIYPGYQFQNADGLITNFHLPKSSLYVLVAAFLGLESTRECYKDAVNKNYRFFSYGDAMAIL